VQYPACYRRELVARSPGERLSIPKDPGAVEAVEWAVPGSNQ
jgi:hypothetical protein